MRRIRIYEDFVWSEFTVVFLTDRILKSTEEASAWEFIPTAKWQWKALSVEGQ